MARLVTLHTHRLLMGADKPSFENILEETAKVDLHCYPLDVTSSEFL